MSCNITVNKRVIPADLETPVSLYLKIRDLFPVSALLESSDYHTSSNAMSYIGVNPIGEFTLRADTVHMTWPDGSARKDTVESGVKVTDVFNNYLRSYTFTSSDGTPIADNVLFGFTAYDAVRYFEKVDIQPREERFRDIPDMQYVFFRYVISLNHYKNELTIYERVLPGEASGIDELISVIHNNNIAQYPFSLVGEPSSPITDEEYMDMVRRGISHALRGDVFQIVLSRRHEQSFRGDDFNVYRALRCVNPSPYLFYFDFSDFRLFGSSPETHLRVSGNTAYIDPIAGTFKRTGNDVRDHELAQALLLDEKENAEHIMLVDLARNDLSRSGGTVSIDFLRQIQYYSHVIHMVSRVKATLPHDVDRLGLFAATFPAGTLSGAPKVRSMQLINELEPHSRVVYGGCIGVVGFNGDLNQAITIRSFLSYDHTLYSQAGAGIVARSNPESELMETSNKLGALRSSLIYAGQFGK
ncbi:MAG: anthranilate synthase component I family protein [Candidatus Amulumruptor caecigallinarius]|nr:anthranilate synthase component I family protein [Candidatus Amulumruptor caecigallinarius]MCM1397275.1 anthranilate synthase component I family protein [Candidatus Amulumruptor caecigallinarius]MCM1453660.1 anthranilate synthase component I family protein [bacterium]